MAIQIKLPICQIYCRCYYRTGSSTSKNFVTLVKNGLVLLAGEIATSAWVDMEGIVRDVVKNIGYKDAKFGL